MVEIQGSFCSEPPHGFIYDPCELGKRLAVCLFYFILLRSLVHTGMRACVLRNSFANCFLVSLAHGAGPGPNATAMGPCRIPSQVGSPIRSSWGREKHQALPKAVPPPSAVPGSPAQGWRKSLKTIHVPVLTRRLFIDSMWLTSSLSPLCWAASAWHGHHAHRWELW